MAVSAQEARGRASPYMIRRDTHAPRKAPGPANANGATRPSLWVELDGARGRAEQAPDLGSTPQGARLRGQEKIARRTRRLRRGLLESLRLSSPVGENCSRMQQQRREEGLCLVVLGTMSYSVTNDLRL